MPFTLLFIVGSISERIFNIEIGPIRFGAGDLVIILSVPYAVLVYGKIKTVFLKLAALAFVVVFLAIFLNSYSFGYNSLITVPLRVIAAGVIANELLKLNRPTLWIYICAIMYFLSLFFGMFFSDGSVIQIIELFNRNELLGYSVVLVILALFASYKRNTDVDKPIGLKQVGLILFLVCVAAILQSRQNVLALFVGMLVLFTFLPARAKAISMTGSIVLLLSLGPLIASKVSEDERLTARLSTVIEFEPATRADNYRLSNILQAIEGFKNSPIYGNGPTSFRRDNIYNKVSHSTPFSILYELGLFGLTFLATVFYLIVRLPIQLKKTTVRQPAMIMLASLMPVIVIQSFFIELLPKATMYVYLGVSVAALVCIRNHVKNKLSEHDLG